MEIEKEEESVFEPLPPGYSDKRINSTSTMFISTNPSNPNIKTIVLACSSILHNLMLEDHKAKRTIKPEQSYYLFSEEYYFKEKMDTLTLDQVEHLREFPIIQNIYEFIKTLNECARFGPECCIVALVYINRFFNHSGSPLLPCNWRPIVLCSLIVAQKVWHDVEVRASEYAFIYPFFTAEQISKMEHHFLQLINYNLIIKRSIYLKQYFELRSLVKSDQEFPQQPLDNITADRLESFSKLIQNRQKTKCKDKRAMTEPKQTTK